MTTFKVELSNGRTVCWEYIGSLGKAGLGQAERGIIRTHYENPSPRDATDGFGVDLGDAIVDLLRACRDRNLWTPS